MLGSNVLGPQLQIQFQRNLLPVKFLFPGPWYILVLGLVISTAVLIAGPCVSLIA